MKNDRDPEKRANGEFFGKEEKPQRERQLEHSESGVFKGELRRGDRVFVKLWDEMLEDERVLQDHKGNLYEKDKPGNSFVKEMKRYCGSAAVIDEVTEDGSFRLVFGKEKSGYLFREWMLEPTEEKRTVFIVSGGDE